MKNIQDKEVMRGDAVVYKDASGATFVGYVHELYDRDNSLRISGYALRVPAGRTVLASDAFDAVASQENVKTEQTEQKT